MSQRSEDDNFIGRATGEQFEAWQKVMFRYVRKMLPTASRDDISDIVQEALIRVWTHRAKYRETHKGTSPPIETWLVVVARRSAYGWWRREKRHAENRWSLSEADEDTLESGCVDPEDATMILDDVNRIEKAMKRVPEAYRRILIMRYLEDLSESDVAALEGLSAKTTRLKLWRARNMVRARISELEGSGRYSGY